MTVAEQAAPGSPPAVRLPRGAASVLLAAGIIAFAIAIGGYVLFAVTHPSDRWVIPVDLNVYRKGGLIVRHLTPLYRPQVSAPLYEWPGDALKFTYPPFAAMTFTLFTLTSFATLIKIWVGVNIAAMVATIWLTLGGLGYRPGRARAGATLLLAAAAFWTEPVQRTLFLGQIELVLMLLIIWDQCQPDRRWWKGAGIGIAAGIKLVPLIFIPYLLLTRRYRQAAVATGFFAATVLAGFVVLPGDSVKWWLDGLFVQGSRTGFVGWEGNQSLLAIITRLSGSAARGQPFWLVAAAVTVVAGLAAAAVIDRAGHRLAGLLTCALTGLLVSPISWDHHWVWIVPGVTLLACYAVAAGSAGARWALGGLAVLVVGVFGAWPGTLWGAPVNLGAFWEGLIWAPPNTNPGTYFAYGDQPWYVEYHWHGFELITGNLYVLTGLGLFVLLLGLAGWVAAAHRPAGGQPARRRPGAAPAGQMPQEPDAAHHTRAISTPRSARGATS
jgi:alpha-1,2-mannosyltransferase